MPSLMIGYEAWGRIPKDNAIVKVAVGGKSSSGTYLAGNSLHKTKSAHDSTRHIANFTRRGLDVPFPRYQQAL
jgi:hypothetical protein